jgi:hypothetical protein
VKVKRGGNALEQDLTGRFLLTVLNFPGSLCLSMDSGLW